MNCKHIQHQLTIAASLSDEEQAHISSCDSCKAVSKKQRAVSRSLEMVAAVEPTIGTAERAFRAAMSGESVIKTPSFLERLLPMATPIAAAAAAAAVIAVLAGSPTPTPESVDSVASGLLSEDDSDDLGDVLALGDEL